MSARRPLTTLLILLSIALLPAACGGGGGGGSTATNPPAGGESPATGGDTGGGGGNAGQPPNYALRLTPNRTTLPLGATLTATLLRDGQPVTEAVRWRVNGVEGGDHDHGTVTAGGVYTAPANATLPLAVTLRGEPADDAGHGAEVALTPFRVTIALTPSQLTLPLGGGHTFSPTVTVEPTGLTGLDAIQWRINGLDGGDPTVGQVDAAGHYTAPTALPAAGNPISVEAVSQADPRVSARAEVTLAASPPPAAGVTVAVAPQPERVALGATVTFTATVTGTGDKRIQWFVNGIEGGSPATGTVSPLGRYKAPMTMPTAPLAITVEARSLADATASDAAHFVLEQLDATPSVVRTAAAAASQPITLTATLSRGGPLDLTASPAIRATTDHAAVATVAGPPAPRITFGNQVGETMVRFRDTGAAGSPEAGVLAIADTDYDLAVAGPIQSYRTRERRRLHVTRTARRGPDKGATYDIASSPALHYRALDTTGWVNDAGAPQPAPDPATYVAYIDPRYGDVVFGDRAGTTRFEVTDTLTNKRITFTVELFDLEITPEVWINNLRQTAAAAYPVRITPEGALGLNQSAVVAVRIRVRHHPEIGPQAIADGLRGTRVRFSAPAGAAAFVPIGIELDAAGAFPYQIPPDPNLLADDGTTAEARSPILTDRIVPANPMVPAMINGTGIYIENAANGAAEVVVRDLASIPISVEIPGTATSAPPAPITLTGTLPAAEFLGLEASPDFTGAVQYLVDFGGLTISGLTPRVEYRLAGSTGAWSPATLLGPTASGPAAPFGGPGVTSRGFTGLSGLINPPVAPGAVYDVRFRFAEYPDLPVATQTPGASQLHIPPDPLVTVTHAVQDLATGAFTPVHICSRVAEPVAVSGLTTQLGLTFQITGGPATTAPNVVTLATTGQCVDLLPRPATPLDAGQGIEALLTASAGNTAAHPNDTPIAVYLTGSTLLAEPALLVAPPNRTGDLLATLALRGGTGFRNLLAAYGGAVPTPTVEATTTTTPPRSYSVAVTAIRQTAADTVELDLTLPQAYFDDGGGDLYLHVAFAATDAERFIAGPIGVAQLTLDQPLPPVLPLNATWPDATEPGTVSVRLHMEGSNLPVHFHATVDSPGAPDTPLVAFGRAISSTTPGGPVYALTPTTRDVWVGGGQTAVFDLYGDTTDQDTSAAGGSPGSLPDSLPDRVSSNEDDIALSLDLVRATGDLRLLDHTLTAFNFVGRMGGLRALAPPETTPRFGALDMQTAFDNLTLPQADLASGDLDFTPPNDTRDVWLNVDHGEDQAPGMLEMGYWMAGTGPDGKIRPATGGGVDDGRWSDFVGEPTLGEPAPLPEYRSHTGGGHRLEPFGVTLGGVCFDPWTFFRKDPNSATLFSFLTTPPTLMGDGLLYQEGGASGGEIDGSRYRLTARTPGVDYPGLDCGYLRAGPVAGLATSIEDNEVMAADPGLGSTVTFAKEVDGKSAIRTVISYGGKNAYFEVTTDPTHADGSPLVDASALNTGLLLTRYPVTLRDTDLLLTTRYDGTAALEAATSKVLVSALTSAVAAALTATTGPVGLAILASAGISTGFQIWDNQAVDTAGGSYTARLQGSALATPAPPSWPGSDALPTLWEVSRSSLAQQALSSGTNALAEHAGKEGSRWLVQAGESLQLTTAGLTGNVASSLLADEINGHLTPEAFSSDHAAHAYAGSQVALFIPESAVVGDPNGGLRGAWLARLARRDLDLGRARAMWNEIKKLPAAQRSAAAVARIGGKDRSAPFFQIHQSAIGPLVLLLYPKGAATPADPTSPATPPALVDFRVHVGSADTSRFPFVATTIAEVSRTSPEATARVAIDQSEAPLWLRLVAAHLDTITVGNDTWSPATP